MLQNAIPILVSWSGGKDSILALFEIMKTSAGPFELFTTINVKSKRVVMHRFNEQLLDKQAESLGLPLHKIYVPDSCSNNDYEEIMEEFLIEMKSRGINTVVFGDLFLEDIRKYKEKYLSKLQMTAIFPLWGTPVTNIALEFIRKGFRAVLSFVDTSLLSKEFIGREFSIDLLGDLPLNVDPCGECGEFHTFVYDGPLFSFPVQFQEIEIQEES